MTSKVDSTRQRARNMAITPAFMLLMMAFAPVASATMCSAGILHRNGQTCCAASCGTCGDAGCSNRTGGKESCCTRHIVTTCQNSTQTGCNVEMSPPLPPSPSPPLPTSPPVPSSPPSQMCSAGILHRNGQTCCAASCGTCGDAGCSNRTGGKESCCTRHIVTTCQNSTQTGCNVEMSPPLPPSPSPPPLTPSPHTSSTRDVGNSIRSDQAGGISSTEDAFGISDVGSSILSSQLGQSAPAAGALSGEMLWVIIVASIALLVLLGCVAAFWMGRGSGSRPTTEKMQLGRPSIRRRATSQKERRPSAARDNDQPREAAKIPRVTPLHGFAVDQLKAELEGTNVCADAVHIIELSSNVAVGTAQCEHLGGASSPSQVPAPALAAENLAAKWDPAQVAADDMLEANPSHADSTGHTAPHAERWLASSVSRTTAWFI